MQIVQVNPDKDTRWKQNGGDNGIMGIPTDKVHAATYANNAGQAGMYECVYVDVYNPCWYLNLICLWKLYTAILFLCKS